MSCLVDRQVLRRGALISGLNLALAMLPPPAVASSIWTELTPPSQEVLHAIRFYNRTDGFAVGNAGTIIRYAKGSWQNYPSGSDQNLYDVALINSGEAWAVGETGTILSLRPRAVTVTQTLPVPFPLAGSICLLSCDQMWIPQAYVDFAVPSYSSYVAGHISVVLSPASIQCSQVVVAGTSCSTTPKGCPAVGTNTETVTVTPSTGPASTDCGLVYDSPGASTTTHAPTYAWIAWAQYSDPSLTFTAGEPPDGIAGPLDIRVGVSDAFAGTTVTLGYQYLPAPGWRPDPQSQALTLLPLHAVSFLNPSNGWACGGDSLRGGIVLHYDGASWVSATTTKDALYGLALVGSDDIWFCGANRRIMHFDGSQFSRVDPQVGLDYSNDLMDNHDWHAVAFPFKSIGWVVGDNGAILRYSANDRTFRMDAQSSALFSGTLYAASLLPDTGRGYIVGEGGVRLHYNGGAFEYEAAGGEDLNGIALLNELEGTAVGGVTHGRIVAERAVTTETTTADMRVFPNPLDPGKGDILTIDKLPSDVTSLAIYTLRGELVDDLAHTITYQPVTGIARWNGQIHGGRPAASGTYLIRVETRRGSHGKGVFLVVRK